MANELQKHIKKIQTKCANQEELVCKQFKVEDLSCAILYMRGQSNVDQISQMIIYPALKTEQGPKSNVLNYLMDNVFTFPDLSLESAEQKVIDAIGQGDAIIVVDGQKQVIKASVNNFKERGITEPPTSAVLKGPREGFVENIKTNIVLLRRILSSEDLKMKYLQVGRYSKTQVCVAYIEGIAVPKVVDAIVQKIQEIQIDGVLDSFYVAQFLEEHPQSMFKQIGSAEKPDIVAGKILEGRVAVFVDGSPIVLTLPFIFLEDIQNSDDYYSQHIRASFLRILRICSIAITLLFPALYIAIELYHYKAIPLKFIVTIVNSTQGLPLTPLAEMLFVLILFEILYEASLRMPKYLGLALSVVGALILGDTAVKAGLISPPAVMIVAVSGITLYTIPDQAPQLSLLRMAFTLAGGILGFYGIIVLAVFIMVYLNDFDNYGAAYFAPFSPHYTKDYKDAIIKVDLTDMKTRPRSIPNERSVRMYSSRRGKK